MLARLMIAGAALAAVALLGTPAGAGQTRHESTGSNWLVTQEGKAKVAYVLMRKLQSKGRSGTRTDYSSTGSGETEDFRDARRARDREDQDILWVRLDDERFVIRDRSVIDELEEICLPQQLLGQQQGLLGKQQGRLGKEQARLGAEQAALGARQARASQRQSAISAEISRRAAEGRATPALERDLRETSREQSEIGQRQSELGELQSQLGQEQSELGRRQSELGRQQSDLGREIDLKVAGLIRRAIAKGLGEPTS